MCAFYLWSENEKSAAIGKIKNFPQVYLIKKFVLKEDASVWGTIPRFYWKGRSPCLIFLLLFSLLHYVFGGAPTGEERSPSTIKVSSSGSLLKDFRVLVPPANVYFQNANLCQSPKLHFWAIPLTFLESKNIDSTSEPHFKVKGYW